MTKKDFLTGTTFHLKGRAETYRYNAVGYIEILTEIDSVDVYEIHCRVTLIRSNLFEVSAFVMQRFVADTILFKNCTLA